jgi:hypothetical protein
MRAEEGDETVEDYAVEGKQALSRIKDSQSEAGSRIGRVARRFLGLWQDEPGSRRG